MSLDRRTARTVINAVCIGQLKNILKVPWRALDQLRLQLTTPRICARTYLLLQHDQPVLTDKAISMAIMQMPLSVSYAGGGQPTVPCCLLLWRCRRSSVVDCKEISIPKRPNTEKYRNRNMYGSCDCRLISPRLINALYQAKMGIEECHDIV